MSTLKIGVLALQGDFREHQHSVERLGAATVEIRHLRDLDRIDALIIPGGESTTINKFDEAFGGKVFTTISEYGLNGMPIYGTCMGSIVLASRIEAINQKSMGLMDITVRRNAYGPQRASFETMLDIEELGAQPFPAVFIRAPQIVETGPGVTVMATIGDTIAMARQGRFLLTTFHPEITDDLRVHQYFLDMIKANSTKQAVPAVAQLHHQANTRPSLTLVGS